MPQAVLPKVPKKLFSLLGAVPVVLDPNLFKTSKEWGHCDFTNRSIKLDTDAPLIGLWQTFGHEAMHYILLDGAASQGLTEDQTEAICDAFGTWFAAAIRAGYLKVVEKNA